MRCAGCRQNKLRPSRSMNKTLSRLQQMLYIWLRCYRCGLLRYQLRLLWWFSQRHHVDSNSRAVNGSLEDQTVPVNPITSEASPQTDGACGM